jgi:hypothetical protein
MRELLEAAAWGPGTGETSVEFQMRRKWESALDELATLDFDGVQVEFVQALEALERIARQTTFAPESRDAPVQVMGPLEAAGGSFDAARRLWCSAMRRSRRTGGRGLRRCWRASSWKRLLRQSCSRLRVLA